MALAFAVTVGLLSDRWHSGYAPFYDKLFSTELFDRLAQSEPNGITICVLDMRSYPFFGSARQFHVCQPYWVRSSNWWWQYLQDRGVRLIAILGGQSQDGRGWGAARGWCDNHRLIFEQVEQANTYWAYWVKSKDVSR